MVHRHLLHGSIREPKIAFLYLAISVVAVTCVMTYSGVAGLTLWQTLLLLLGGLIGAWATVFSFLEVRRLAQNPKDRAGEALPEEADPYSARTVVVALPTGDPYPHHEDYPESSGLDQGQLTSQLRDSTPLIDGFLSRWRTKKEMAARNRRGPGLQKKPA